MDITKNILEEILNLQTQVIALQAQNITEFNNSITHHCYSCDYEEENKRIIKIYKERIKQLELALFTIYEFTFRECGEIPEIVSKLIYNH